MAMKHKIGKMIFKKFNLLLKLYTKSSDLADHRFMMENNNLWYYRREYHWDHGSYLPAG